MNRKQGRFEATRREILQVGAGALALVITRPALATPESMAAAIKAFAGEAEFQPGPGAEPLPPGDYELRLLHDESYVVLAKAPFRVLP